MVKKQNRMPKIYLILIFFLYQACTTSTSKVDFADNQLKINTIAFGSCNNQDLNQPLWQEIHKNKPQIWLWLGDNIYGDSNDMKILKAKYTKQTQNPDYQTFIKNTKVFGIWDDHDYGKNDAGNDYAKREESQQLMLDFLGVAQDAPLRKRRGAYSSVLLGKAGERIKIIFLDARYFRDKIYKGKNGYEINKEGTILGEKQWQWLESQLADNEANVHILACGIQMISAEHKYEKWANFPHERQKLFDLLQKYQVKNPIFLSGDRHIGEISQLKFTNHSIFEVTSSGLTHAWEDFTGEPNRYRISRVINQLNFGLLHFDWSKKQVSLQIRGLENKILAEKVIEIQ